MVLSDDMSRIKVTLERRLAGHRMEERTLTTVSDSCIENCETRYHVLNTVLGIQAQGKPVLQHLIDVATEPARAEAATEPMLQADKPNVSDFDSWAKLLPHLGDTVRIGTQRLVITGDRY
jgi:hypothetical protein